MTEENSGGKFPAEARCFGIIKIASKVHIEVVFAKKVQSSTSGSKVVKINIKMSIGI